METMTAAAPANVAVKVDAVIILGRRPAQPQPCA